MVHHRSSWLRQSNKGHKSSFRSKRALSNANRGRINSSHSGSTASLASRNRADRHNATAVQRKNKQAQVLRHKRLMQPTSARRIVAVIPLAATADAVKFVENLQATESTIHPNTTQNSARKIEGNRVITIGGIDFFLPGSDPMDVLDIAKACDVLCFVMCFGEHKGRGMEECLLDTVDENGRSVIQMLKAQGLCSVVGVYQGADGVNSKHTTALKRQASLFFTDEFGDTAKSLPCPAANNTTQYRQTIRALTEVKLKDLSWRMERSYMLGESVQQIPTQHNAVSVEGCVRGRPLGLYQLLHVTGVGSFQIKKIEVLQTKKGSNLMQEDICLVADESKIPSLKEEATPDIMAGEQTWPTTEEMDHTPTNPIQPEEEEDYQAAWLSDDDTSSLPPTRTVKADSEDNAAQHNTVEELRAWKLLRAEEEVLYPDEVEVESRAESAKNRFMKYRGLKSFKHSQWHPQESLPREYARIHIMENPTSIQGEVLREGKELQDEWLQNGAKAGVLKADYISPGTRVRIHLLNVSQPQVDLMVGAKRPIVIGSLLAHEQKLTVLNANIKRTNTYQDPVKSRELLTMQCGFWRRQVRPTFSENNLNCDKHKLDRYLHEGRWTVASAYAPITFGTNVPVLLFKTNNTEAQPETTTDLIASGTLLDLNPNRIVLKKAVLTGYPIRIKKRKAVIRFMFFNAQDVAWFKPVELWTKHGASGRILESVGTHGLFKAIFDRVNKSNDTVCLSLYKRVFPKPVLEFQD